MNEEKTLEEKFFALAEKSEEAIEDFNDFADDRKIVWAAREIKHLRELVKVLKSTEVETLCTQDADEIERLRNSLRDAAQSLWDNSANRAARKAEASIYPPNAPLTGERKEGR